MAVGPISRTHSSPQEKPAVAATTLLAQNGGSKSTASTEAVAQGHTQSARGTPATAAVGNHTGQEQGNGQHSEEESKGMRVNV